MTGRTAKGNGELRALGGKEHRSSVRLAGLKDVDGLGQLPGPPATAAEFAQDTPSLELGVGTLARARLRGS
jgi:hypothetical protein